MLIVLLALIIVFIIFILVLLSIRAKFLNVARKVGFAMLIHFILMLSVRIYSVKMSCQPILISPKLLLVYLFGLSYLISSIGVLMCKRWGRTLATYVTAVLAIWSFAYWMYIGFSEYAEPSIAYDALNAGFVFGFITFIIPICLPSLIFLIILTRPKVKRASGERNP